MGLAGIIGLKLGREQTRCGGLMNETLTTVL